MKYENTKKRIKNLILQLKGQLMSIFRGFCLFCFFKTWSHIGQIGITLTMHIAENDL